VKDLGSVSKRLAKTWGTHRDDHELLKIEIVIGVGPTVDNVHHWHWQGHWARPTKVTIERQACLLGRGPGGGHRHRQKRIGPQA